MTTHIRRALAATSLVAGLSLVGFSNANAQTSGPRWQAWMGCWSASAPQSGVELKGAPVTCVAPTANPDAAQIITLSEDKVLGRDTIDASGAERVVNTRNCAGTQTARWSSDERRIYLKSTSTCDGMRSTTSAILSIASNGDWLDVRDVSAGEGSNVRVARFHPARVPAAMADSVPASPTATGFTAARIAAGAPVGPSAVKEAVKNVDADVVESWIMERAQKFALDGNTLASLADAGVPGSVTDAMIAVTNPNAFQVARVQNDEREGRPVYAGTMTYPATCDLYNPYYSGYGCSSALGYGYNPYGYGYGYGYGYSGGYYYPPVIVLSGPGITSTSNPKVVKGHGYTQNGSGSTTGTATTRDTGTSTSSTSGGSSTSSSSGTSSSTNSSSGRTAHAKP